MNEIHESKMMPAGDFVVPPELQERLNSKMQQLKDAETKNLEAELSAARAENQRLREWLIYHCCDKCGWWIKTKETDDGSTGPFDTRAEAEAALDAAVKAKVK